MTIQTSVRKARFIGNGVNTAFPFAFKTFSSTDLVLTQTSIAGVDVPVTSLYSISLNVDQESSPGGTVTYPTSGSPLANGVAFTVTSVLAETQLTDLTNAGGFFPKTISDRFDYLTILIQQATEKLARALLGSVSDVVPNFSLGTKLQRANKYPTFDNNGDVVLATSLPSGTLSQTSIGQFLYPQTTAEGAMGVAPVSYQYPYLNVFRYMTAAQIADVTANTATLDVTAAIQAAITALPVMAFPNGGAIVFFPPGTYRITSSLVIPNNKLGFRLAGSWGSVLQMSGAASFDLITWQAVGAGLTILTNGVIDNLRLDGGSLSGAGHLINTQYASALQLRDLLFTNLAVNGNGINVVGNGATYMHDLLISNIYYNTTTGNAIVYMGATSSDSILERIKGNGQFGCKYGIYMATGSAHCHVTDSHPYNHSLNALYVGTNASSHWFVNVRPENCLADSCQLNGTTNCTFTGCEFTYAPTNFADLLLVNSSNNKFANSTFTSGGVSKYAAQETGTSNNNVFNGYTLEGSFTTGPPFAIVGSATMLRASGTDFILAGGPASITAGSTIYLTNGPSPTTAIGVPCLLGGLATQLYVACDTAPGAGQSFTFTLMVNGAASLMTGSITGAASFSTQSIALINIPANQTVAIRVVASAGAAAASIRASLVINQ